MRQVTEVDLWPSHAQIQTHTNKYIRTHNITYMQGERENYFNEKNCLILEVIICK